MAHNQAPRPRQTQRLADCHRQIPVIGFQAAGGFCPPPSPGPTGHSHAFRCRNIEHLPIMPDLTTRRPANQEANSQVRQTCRWKPRGPAKKCQRGRQKLAANDTGSSSCSNSIRKLDKRRDHARPLAQLHFNRHRPHQGDLYTHAVYCTADPEGRRRIELLMEMRTVSDRNGTRPWSSTSTPSIWAADVPTIVPALRFWANKAI